MSWLQKLMFWKNDPADAAIADAAVEAVEGYTVDGCFTLPGDEIDSEAINSAEQPGAAGDARSPGTEPNG